LLQLLLESANLGAQLGDLLVARVAARLATALLAQGTKRPFVALASPLGQLRGIQPFLPEQRAYAAFFLCRLGSLYDRELFGCGVFPALGLGADLRVGWRRAGGPCTPIGSNFN